MSLRAEASVWAELRERGGTPPAFQSRVPAAVVDPSVQIPARATASLTVDGRAIVWLAAPLDAVVLDGAAFAPLRGVDVTRVSTGSRAVVGRVMTRAREQLGERGVIELLLRAEVLRSYWGRGAELCLRHESAVSGTYRATWRGVPLGASRRSGEEVYAFVVEIDPEGEVSVTRAAAP